jgi:16S rRNA C967 or C1407 C5-methylase (RsmB/RsmF family)
MAMPVSKDVVVAAGTGDPMQGGAELEPKAPVRKPVKGTLERGWVSHRLIREIALGDKTGKELAEQYGVSSTSISNFKNRHALEIEEVRNNLADEYAGLWVAKKLGRITEYQKAAEKMIGNNSPRNAEVLVNILKAVAEELGQLPARTQVNITNEVTTYEIVGIDPEDI